MLAKRLLHILYAICNLKTAETALETPARHRFKPSSYIQQLTSGILRNAYFRLRL